MTRTDVLRIAAPVIAMGGVFIVRKAMTGGFQAATGSQPPKPDDLDESLTKVVLYTAGVAVAAAVINTLVQRGVAKAVARQEEPLPQTA